jgi:hypothetical protein
MNADDFPSAVAARDSTSKLGIPPGAATKPKRRRGL